MAIDQERLTQLLRAVKSGELSPEEAARCLALLPYEDLGFAKLDYHRELRCGFPEVVLGQGKSKEQIAAIAQKLAAQSQRLLITKVDADCFELVRRGLPDAVYHPEARALTLNRLKGVPPKPGVMVVSGGTADIPVAEEAAVTAELIGNQVERSYDIGVAGIHRLFDNLPRLRRARVLVVVAGLEGALPSVIGGLVSVPIIAVPTSVGYGASFQGVAPLLAMLNSCAAGVAVVNIDNGFGAGYMAALINSLPPEEPLYP